MENNVVWTVDKVRETFVDFFCKQKGHTNIHSSPVVPHDDPTLLFTNAGMNQFKPLFLGTVDPASPLAKLKRVANSQKCIRAGGKHNDLDDVGKDTYHHTFFEMLGNWSFGDYFKEEGIAWAWELLVKVFGLDPKRIYVTYFRGEKGIEADEEARQIWLKYLPTERVLPFGMKENFWEMGETGPCGPCSEIHYDRIGGRDASAMVNRDDPTVIEIWNLVFIQFNREASGELKRLPAKHVDTGMGLERLTSILQDKMSNYDADTFSYLFKQIQTVSGARPYGSVPDAPLKDPTDVAYRVIADHIRTLTFAVNDGAQPGATGRNYVIKRILRRAVYYGHHMLHAPNGFFSKLVPNVVQRMGPAFPNDRLEHNVDRIMEVLRREEELFLRTLDKGIQKFNRIADKVTDGVVVPAQKAFVLYTTYGFPIDLTEIMAETRKLRVDRKGFEELMKKHSDVSDGGPLQLVRLTLDVNRIDQLKKKEVPATDDKGKFDYDAAGHVKSIEAKVRAIFDGTNFVDSFDAHKTVVGVVLDRTNFYAEMGGQSCDLGHLSSHHHHHGDSHHHHEHTFRFEVQDVQQFGPYVLHVGTIKKGGLKVSQAVHTHIDASRRFPIMQNHTSTHMLNHALRSVLKRAADQRGSLVLPERFRFDFAHDTPLTHEQLVALEKHVSHMISQDLKVSAQEVDQQEALSKLVQAGLRHMPGENYPNPVRVIAVGRAVPELLAKPTEPSNLEFSIEFCGGTHMLSVGPVASFTICTQESVSAGVRRIIAVTGELSKHAISKATKLKQELHVLDSKFAPLEELAKKADADREALNRQYQELEMQVNLFVKELESKDIVLPAAARMDFDHHVKGLQHRLKSISKGFSKNTGALASDYAEKVIAQLTAHPALFHVGKLEVESDEAAVRKAMTLISTKFPQLAILMFTSDPNEKLKKLLICSSVPKELTGKLKAGDWVKEVALCCGGKGGGKPELANAYGCDLTKYDEAVAFASKFAEGKLKQ